MDSFGRRLQSARIKLKISKAELGRRSGVHPSTIGDLENFRTGAPSVATVSKLTEGLGVDPAYFYGARPERVELAVKALKDHLSSDPNGWTVYSAAHSIASALDNRAAGKVAS